MQNLLIHGDNIEGLQYLLQQGYGGRVDLIYIDPPFATGGNFTVSAGRASTISQAKSGTIAYTDKLIGADFVESIRRRLVLARELLSERGSIYLHTDYKIGHYLRVMMDEVFGIDNFRGDITRIKCNPKNFSRIGYGNIKDMILFYSKTKKPIWNEPHEPYTQEELQRLYPKKDAAGRRYTTVPIHAPGETDNPALFKGMLPPKGRHWRTDVPTLEQWDREGLIEWSERGNPRKIIYADERPGKRVQDVWTFKDPQYPVYPTEKNDELLERIISTSSHPESIVLDFYCGSGTTLSCASKLGRHWIGIDASPLAIQTTQKKLGWGDDGLFRPSDVLISLHPSPSLMAE